MSGVASDAAATASLRHDGARPVGRPDLRVALLAGGRSDERSVALETARCVEASLRIDDGRGPALVERVEWTADGRFAFDGRSGGWTEVAPWLAGFDVVFLALHGGWGEDGTLQGALELLGVPYTGSGVGPSALAMDKQQALAVAASVGLRTPRGLLLGRGDLEAPGRGGPGTGAAEGLAERLAALGARGWMVKPNRGGSSLAAAAVPADASPLPAIEHALEHADQVRVEERVVGVEVTCPVLGAGAGARTLTPIEIVPAEGRYFDFEQKYAADGALERCPPRLIEPRRVARVEELALRVHRAFGCRGLTRVDFLCPEEGDPVFLELNTLPGFTDRSLAPQGARDLGLDHRDLCLLLLEQALAASGRGG